MVVISQGTVFPPDKPPSSRSVIVYLNHHHYHHSFFLRSLSVFVWQSCESEISVQFGANIFVNETVCSRLTRKSAEKKNSVVRTKFFCGRFIVWFVVYLRLLQIIIAPPSFSLPLNNRYCTELPKKKKTFLQQQLYDVI